MFTILLYQDLLADCVYIYNLLLSNLPSLSSEMEFVKTNRDLYNLVKNDLNDSDHATNKVISLLPQSMQNDSVKG